MFSTSLTSINQFLHSWLMPSEEEPSTMGKPAVLLFFIALMPRLWFLYSNGLFLLPDSVGRYLPMGLSLFREWRGSIYDTPGYALFIYGTAGLFKSEYMIAVVQALLGSFTVVMVWDIGRRLGLRRWAWLPALYFALEPVGSVLANAVLSEVLFTFLVIGSLWTWIRLRPQSKPSTYLCLGLFVAAATLTRANGILLLVIFSGLMSLQWLYGLDIKRLILFLIAALIPVLTWVGINYKLQQLPRVSLGSGWQMLQAVAYFELLDPKTLPEEDRAMYQDWRSLSHIRPKYINKKLDRREHIKAERMFGDIAWENVKHQPLGYLKAMGLALTMPRHEMYDFSKAPLKSGYWEHNRRHAERFKYGHLVKAADDTRLYNRYHKWAMVLAFKAKYPLLVLLIFPGLWFAIKRRHLGVLLLVSIPAINVLVLTLMLNPIDRYYYPFAPMLLLSTLWVFLFKKERVSDSKAEQLAEVTVIPEGEGVKQGKGLIIIPAYNEAVNLPKVVARCRALASWDLVVINDGSSDHSAEVLAELAVPHINLPINLGIGGAVQTGYRYAAQHGYDFAAQIDGDGQHDPAFLEALLPHLADANCVIGSRFLEGQGFQSTPLRLIGIKLISGVLYLTTGISIKDPTSGMRVVDRKVIARFTEYYPDDFPEPETLAMLLRSGWQVKEVPVVMQSRHGGESSIAGFKSALYMIQVLPKILLSSVFRRFT